MYNSAFDTRDRRNYTLHSKYNQDSFAVQHSKLCMMEIQQYISQGLDMIANDPETKLDEFVKMFNLIARAACHANIQILVSKEPNDVE